jgi:hypothetical protein
VILKRGEPVKYGPLDELKAIIQTLRGMLEPLPPPRKQIGFLHLP